MKAKDILENKTAITSLPHSADGAPATKLFMTKKHLRRRLSGYTTGYWNCRKKMNYEASG